jgi:hypothetical protein
LDRTCRIQKMLTPETNATALDGGEHLGISLSEL